MGYYSDFGLRLEFKNYEEFEGIEGLFISFLNESDLLEEFERLDYINFDTIFQNVSYLTKSVYGGEKVYICDVISYSLKFYSTLDYEGKWVEKFISWLGEKEICEFHFIRVGESWEDIEEICTDNIEFPLSMTRQIDFE